MAHNLPHTTAPPPSLTELGIRLAGDVPRDELGVGGSLLRRYLRKWRRAISDMLRITSSPAQLAPSSSSSLTSRCTPSSSSSPGHTPPTPARDLPPAPALATSQMSVQHRSDAKALNRALTCCEKMLNFEVPSSIYFNHNEPDVVVPLPSPPPPGLTAEAEVSSETPGPLTLPTVIAKTSSDVPLPPNVVPSPALSPGVTSSIMALQSMSVAPVSSTLPNLTGESAHIVSDGTSNETDVYSDYLIYASITDHAPAPKFAVDAPVATTESAFKLTPAVNETSAAPAVEIVTEPKRSFFPRKQVADGAASESEPRPLFFTRKAKPAPTFEEQKEGADKSRGRITSVAHENRGYDAGSEYEATDGERNTKAKWTPLGKIFLRAPPVRVSKDATPEDPRLTEAKDKAINASEAEVAARAALKAAERPLVKAAERALVKASKRTRDAKAAVKVAELEIAAEAKKFRAIAAWKKAEAMYPGKPTSAPPVIAAPPPAPQITFV